MKNGRGYIVNITNLIQSFTKNIIMIFLVCFSVFNFLQSIFSTSFIDNGEIVYFAKDSVWINIIVVGAIILTCIMLNNKRIKKNRSIIMPSKRFFIIITIIYALLLAAFVSTVRVYPIADQMEVLNAAKDLVAGNYEEWRQGGYCYNYPNQNGIILFMAVITKIFGGYNWIVVEILNILALIVVAVFCSKTIYLLFEDVKLAGYSYLFLLGFLPMNLYVTFVYGTLFGLTLSIVGIYFLIKYFKNKKIGYGILGIFLVAISCELKSNYLIFFVAMMLIVVYDIIVRRKIHSVIVLLCGMIFLLSSSILVSVTMESKTGVVKSDGVPTKAWVCMGIQEGNRAPGWYNGYLPDVLKNNNYDQEQTKELISKDIHDRLNVLLEDKSYGMEFFSRKVASQWNEGTFQGFWINSVRTKGIGWSTFVKQIMMDGGPINEVLVHACNIFLTLLWLGILLFIILDRKKLNIYQLVFAIIFIGGFIFHLFWEAKGQYTVIYVYLLIPYMIRGYQLLLSDTEKSTRENRFFKNQGMIELEIIFAFVILIAWLHIPIINNTIKLSGDERNYDIYIKMSWNSELEQGKYLISPLKNKDANLIEIIEGDERNDYEVVVEDKSIKVVSRNNRRSNGERALDVTGGLYENGVPVQLFKANGSRAQSWLFEKVKENIFVIRTYNDFALTYDEKQGKITIEKYTGNKNQKWVFIKSDK